MLVVAAVREGKARGAVKAALAACKAGRSHRGRLSRWKQSEQNSVSTQLPSAAIKIIIRHGNVLLFYK